MCILTRRPTELLEPGPYVGELKAQSSSIQIDFAISRNEIARRGFDTCVRQVLGSRPGWNSLQPVFCACWVVLGQKKECSFVPRGAHLIH